MVIDGMGYHIIFNINIKNNHLKCLKELVISKDARKILKEYFLLLNTVYFIMNINLLSMFIDVSIDKINFTMDTIHQI